MAGFNFRAYPFWFVRLIYDGLKLDWLPGALVAALAPYVLALILVTPFGKAGLYVRTPAFYIGYAGVALVLAAGVRGIEILTDGLSELQEVAAEPVAFHEYVDNALATAAHDRSNMGYLGACAAGAIAVVVAALHRWHQDAGVLHAGGHFRAFPVDWQASSSLLPAGLALSVFAVAVVATFGSSLILLVRNIGFAWRLRTFKYVPFPGRVRLGTGTLITAYTWVSATWMIGVALFVLFFFQNWSTLNVIGIASLAVAGVLTLMVPYLSFRKILDDTHEEMASLLCKRVGRRVEGGHLADDDLMEFAVANTAITADPPRVLTRRSAIAYGVVQLVAFGSIFARELLQEQVSFLAKEQTKPRK